MNEQEKIIEKLDGEISDRQIEITSLEQSLKDCEAEKDLLQSEIDDRDISDFGNEEIEDAFYGIMQHDRSMVNDCKIELFFKHIDKFTLYEFEDFLRGFLKDKSV